MPRTKTTRNPFGSIFKREITRKSERGGKPVVIKQTVYDARKRYVDADGEKREKFKRCRSATEAQTALTNFAAEIERELSEAKTKPQKNADRTFFDLTKYFRKEYLIEAVFVGDRQIAGYRQNVKKLERMISDFEEYFGNLSLQEFNYEKVRTLSIQLSINPKKSRGATAPPTQSTVNRKMALLRKIFNVGVQLSWLSVNPMNQGKSLVDTRAERHRTKILTFEEERRLLEACSGNQTVKYNRSGREIEANAGPIREHLIPIVIMAIDTGMRKGEIFSVERDQIDLDRLTITLRAEQTKALRSRTIPISSRLRARLEKLFAEKPFAKSEKVFGGVKNCRTSFVSACAAAGIKDIVFHSLRHTAISWLDQAGLSEMVKKTIVGHSTGDVHQIYHNLSDDILTDARAKINAFRERIEADYFAKESVKKKAA